MKALNEMTLVELKKELSSRYEDAFYSECYNPKTEKELAHNKSLSDGIDEVQSCIDKFPK